MHKQTFARAPFGFLFGMLASNFALIICPDRSRKKGYFSVCLDFRVDSSLPQGCFFGPEMTDVRQRIQLFR